MRVKVTKCSRGGKRAYRTEVDAKIAMAGVSTAREKVEQRAYRCGSHWHLTSQTEEEYNLRKASFEKETS